MQRTMANQKTWGKAAACPTRNGLCGQVGERGSCPLTEVTHVLRPAESAGARPMRFARRE